MVDSVVTLLVPSAPQKRLCANGRSAEIISTAVLPTRRIVEFLGRGRAHRGIEAGHDVQQLLLAGEIGQ